MVLMVNSHHSHKIMNGAEKPFDVQWWIVTILMKSKLVLRNYFTYNGEYAPFPKNEEWCWEIIWCAMVNDHHSRWCWETILYAMVNGHHSQKMKSGAETPFYIQWWIITILFMTIDGAEKPTHCICNDECSPLQSIENGD